MMDPQKKYGVYFPKDQEIVYIFPDDKDHSVTLLWSYYGDYIVPAIKLSE